ncbi:MAG: thiamine pyrophosphate-dependent enzyme [Simkaniaceae bacterium]|nr:thiamine pyrophosphate-dependent enzyme [Candidatus Sacchlamyda saccharinae]
MTPGAAPATAIATLKAMHLTRFLDEKMTKLARQNKGGTFHLSSLGHEMIGTMCGLALEAGKDWGLPYYRDRPFAVGFGVDLKDMIAAFLARELPYHSGGRMMPEHFTHKQMHIPCQSSVVGSQFLQAVGVAKGIQLNKKQEVVYVSGGDGSASQGDFHEALNFASIHKLPILFVIQDNGWAISVTREEQTAGGSVAKMMSGYEGLDIHDIDGCDFEEVQGALDASVAKAKAGNGPSLIVASIPRLGAHSSSDDPKKYKDESTTEEEIARDPLPRFENWLKEQGLITDEELESLKKEAFQEVENAADAADLVPHPLEEVHDTKVFKEVEEVPALEKEEANTTDAVVMVDALNQALKEEMERDTGVVVFGQDVARGKGGVFGVTRELTEKFGEKRCFNTPLAESTIVGLSIGLSLTEPLKPVAEIQFADYIWTGINQIFNELSSYYYRSNGEWNCPVVLRMPYGGYIQGGPYHSQSIEAFLAHCPGLKVVIPSNAADAGRLLKASIRDPNPVIFLEHKGLYRQRVFSARKMPAKDEILPLGKANIVRDGTDITLVGWGMTVFMAVDVAEKLSKEGISVEIIDLRTIVPLDFDAIAKSVRKTGKLLIAHEAPSNVGFGAEIAAQISEKEFAYLDAPIQRVTGANCPVPYSKVLEDAVLPQPLDLERALRNLADF